MTDTRLTLGFVPLLDAAPLIVARELGFFRAQGLHVVLSRESSWSSLNDKLAVGLLEGAQMLSPLLLAANLGLGSMRTHLISALTLSVNGNAITLSNRLHQQLLDEAEGSDPKALAQALGRWLQTHEQPLRLATVYPYSSHHYQLRHWLRLGGIEPGEQLQLVAIPPPQMVQRLRAGAIDGFCVGEPWNSLAEHDGVGHIAVTGYQLWPDRPEKLLAVAADWAAQFPEAHLALLRALLQACRWIDDHLQDPALYDLLGLPPYLDHAAEPLRTPDYRQQAGKAPLQQHFYRNQANRPLPEHGHFLLRQMAQAGQLDGAVDEGLVERVFRPDLYAKALASM